MSSESPSLFDNPSAATPSGDRAGTESPHRSTGPRGPVVRVRLDVAYDGAPFRGLAPNPGVRTVVGDLVEVLEPVLGHAPEITMSGRTDAGVHARRQTLTFDTSDTVDVERVQRVVNRRLGADIAALEVRVVDDTFDARHSAIGRRYRYRVLSGPTPDPLLAGRVWWVPEELAVPVMQAAADGFVGEHDFSSFCRRPKTADGTEVSLVRRVREATWRVVDHPLEVADTRLLEFEIEGPAFCHQMVRSITAFCVAVGRGKRSPAEVRAVLAARDRNASVSPAPPDGLTLWDVTYPEGAG